MPRERTFEISALNVVTHPHTARSYLDRFESSYKKEHYVPIRGVYHGMIGTMYYIDSEDPLKGIYGMLFRFTEIKPDSAWLNIVRHEAATEKDLKSLNIPKELKANYSEIPYVFFPKKHRLFFATRAPGTTLGTTSAIKLFDRLLNHNKLQPNQHFDVRQIQSQNALEEIFSLPDLQTLKITIKRPNPDEPEDITSTILENLEEQNANEANYKLTAQDSLSLKPSETTKKLAEVAVSNGSVSAKGKDRDARPKSIDTTDHPFKESGTATKSQTLLQAILTKSMRLIGSNE